MCECGRKTEEHSRHFSRIMGRAVRRPRDPVHMAWLWPIVELYAVRGSRIGVASSGRGPLWASRPVRSGPPCLP